VGKLAGNPTPVNHIDYHSTKTLDHRTKSNENDFIIATLKHKDSTNIQKGSRTRTCSKKRKFQQSEKSRGSHN
jgi:hypothetical protein